MKAVLPTLLLPTNRIRTTQSQCWSSLFIHLQFNKHNQYMNQQRRVMGGYENQPNILLLEQQQRTRNQLKNHISNYVKKVLIRLIILLFVGLIIVIAFSLTLVHIHKSESEYHKALQSYQMFLLKLPFSNYIFLHDRVSLLINLMDWKQVRNLTTIGVEGIYRKSFVMWYHKALAEYYLGLNKEAEFSVKQAISFEDSNEHLNTLLFMVSEELYSEPKMTKYINLQYP